MIFKYWRLEEFVGVGIAEVRERGLVLAHQVNDVTQRLNGHLVALQGSDNDLPQLLDDTGMVGRGDGNIRECGHDLATEHASNLDTGFLRFSNEILRLLYYHNSFPSFEMRA